MCPSPVRTEVPAIMPVKVRTHPPHPMPYPTENLQSLAKMRCVPLATGTRLSFDALACEGTLVFAAGYDKRSPCRLMLRDDSGKWEHLLDVGFCSIAQRFHIPIPAGICQLHVTALDEDPCFWALADSDKLPDSEPAVWPVSQQVDRLSRFFQRLENDCIAEFGWMGGCVLEAIDALAKVGHPQRWRDARDRWLAHFLDDAHLDYQDARSNPRRDMFTIIEATLPVASIIRRQANHPIIDITINYLMSQARRDATCEGCYTVAYPLLQIAAVRKRDDLAELALGELAYRRERLFHEGDIYLRNHSGNRSFRNWTRGIAWYLLGNAECLHTVGMNGPWADVAQHLAERAQWVLAYQRDDGLWDNFLDEKGPPPDSSGSAGIAAALVRAHELGLIGNQAVQAAQRCWVGVQQHLFVDGWLGCVAPSNKQGEAQQHGSKRASETFGMGLMGRLAAALGHDGSR